MEMTISQSERNKTSLGFRSGILVDGPVEIGMHSGEVGLAGLRSDLHDLWPQLLVLVLRAVTPVVSRDKVPFSNDIIRKASMQWWVPALISGMECKWKIRGRVA